jgi:hypothetical protein
LETAASESSAGQRTLEAAEAELNRFIERRAAESQEVNARAALWKDSERSYWWRQRMRARAEWFTYFCRQADAHRKLSEHYEARAEALCEEVEE